MDEIAGSPAPTERQHHVSLTGDFIGPLYGLDVFWIEGCDRLEITVALFPDERAEAAWETWPAQVQRRVTAAYEAWQQRQPDRVVVAITTAAVPVNGRQVVALVIHHRRQA
ncbi:MAG: hypothetical protein HZA68_13070 [Rhodovulum sp.]|nr:hypothetical protein [Rhodovulum sp.]